MPFVAGLRGRSGGCRVDQRSGQSVARERVTWRRRPPPRRFDERFAWASPFLRPSPVRKPTTLIFMSKHTVPLATKMRKATASRKDYIENSSRPSTAPCAAGTAVLLSDDGGLVLDTNTAERAVQAITVVIS